MSSSSSGAAGNSGGGNDEMTEQYTEIEVRASFMDTQKYYNALFPHAPKPKENEKPAPFPPFGKKGFPAPVHMKQEEIVEEVSDDSEEEDVPAFRKFKRRRQYTSRKETRWILKDKKGKNVLHGTDEGQQARYFVMIPPPQNRPSDPFRLVPVEKWIEFKKPPNFKPLSTNEVKAMQESKSSMSKIVEFMEDRQKKMQEELEAAGSRERLRKGERAKTTGAKVKTEDGEVDFGSFENSDVHLLESDDDAEYKKGGASRGGRNAAGLDEEEENGNDEEDIDVLAIDRVGAGRGEGNGDADYEEQFDDDDDDGALLQEEEQLNANEDTLIEGAEEVREAEDDDEEDEEDDEDEEGEEDEMGQDYQQDMEAVFERSKNLDDEDDDLERQKFLDQRTKVAQEENDSKKRPAEASPTAGTAASSSSSNAGQPPARKKAKTPLAMFKESVINAIRQSGGSFDVEKLFKVVLKKKILKQVGMEKKEAQQSLSSILKEVADISEDNITGVMKATLKAAYV